MPTLAETVYEAWLEESSSTAKDLEEACFAAGARQFYYNDGTEADAYVFADRSWVYIVWGGATGVLEDWQDNTLGSNGRPQVF